MSASPKVALLIGSLRKESLSRKLAVALKEIANPSLALDIVDIAQLPHYNQDLESSVPQEWAEFRSRILKADAVQFVTPEYNRSVPGVLKNSLDVGSRPFGKSVWSGKPCAIISVSPGAIGGYGANHHLRQSLVFLDMPALQQPEAYVGGAAALFDEQGNLINESTREFLAKYANRFASWIASNRLH